MAELQLASAMQVTKCRWCTAHSMSVTRWLVGTVIEAASPAVDGMHAWRDGRREKAGVTARVQVELAKLGMCF